MTIQCLVPKIIIEDSDDDFTPPISDIVKLNKLKAGQLLKFNPDDSPENRTIDGQSFLELIQDNTRDIAKPVRIENAVINIQKKLDLRYVTFRRELSIINSIFKGEVDFSFATFEGQVRFDGSTFEKKARFGAAHARYNFDIVGARFVREANFGGLRVDEVLNASGAHFADVDFQRVRVCKDAIFSPYEEKAKKTDDGTADSDEPAKEKIVKAYPVCFKGDANFSDAFIESVADFKGAHFHGKATFVRTRIDSAAFFSCYIREPKDESDESKGEILRTEFNGETNFIASRFGGNVSFIGVVFKDEAEFERIRVGGHVLFRPARFGDQFHRVEFMKRVSFFNAHVQINAEFDGVIFKGKADFELLHIEGNLFLRASYCQDKAACNHPALPVRFEGRTVFMAARVNGRAEFTGAQFTNTNEDDGQPIERAGDDPQDAEEDWKKGNVFESFCVGGKAILDSFSYPRHRTEAPLAVTFGGVANFNNTCFKNEVSFQGTRFEQEAHFVRSEVKGVASFQGAVFNKDVSFRGAHFDVVRFRDELPPLNQATDMTPPATPPEAAATPPEAAKNGVEISAQVAPPTPAGVGNNGSAIQPEGGSAAAGSDANAALARLNAGLNSAVTKVRNLRLKRRPPLAYSWTVFGDDINIDLRGFTYERIELRLNDLLNRLEKSESIPFDRQPYTQLEKTYLSVGDDYRAGDVYYALRRREHNQSWKKLWLDIQNGKTVTAGFRLIAQMFDFIFLRGVTRYGVRPFRLLVISVGFIIAGTIIFSQPGAVVLKEKAAVATEQTGAAPLTTTPSPDPVPNHNPPPVPNPATTANKEPDDNPGCCNRTQAIGVSFNQFIPIVEIASGSQWKPSSKLLWGNHFSYAFYGSLHRLAGVILVPLGLASLTGLLHRRERSGK